MRAGASPESVAAETGWPLDKVARYADPPLGERAYVAEQARAVEISRSRGGSTLEESVAVRLSVDPQDVAWDSYRTDEGKWIVTASSAGALVGAWVYETVGRSVHPLDESARALMGGGPSAVTDVAPTVAPTVERTEPEPGAGPTPSPPVESPSPQAPSQPRPRLVSVSSDPTGGSRLPASSHDQVALLENSDVTGAPRRAKREKSKKGRASVPSWDEILFGASKPED